MLEEASLMSEGRRSEGADKLEATERQLELKYSLVNNVCTYIHTDRPLYLVPVTSRVYLRFISAALSVKHLNDIAAVKSSHVFSVSTTGN